MAIHRPALLLITLPGGPPCKAMPKGVPGRESVETHAIEQLAQRGLQLLASDHSTQAIKPAQAFLCNDKTPGIGSAGSLTA